MSSSAGSAWRSARFPLHTLQGILSFTYAGASPALMGGCARRGVSLAFCTPNGRFLARSVGEENGNVLLRRMQYRAADDPLHSCRIARNMIFGKLYNARWSLERTKRDHAMRVDTARIQNAIDQLEDGGACGSGGDLHGVPARQRGERRQGVFRCIR